MTAGLVVITRPLVDAMPLVDPLIRHGFPSLIEPLLEIVIVPPPQGVDRANVQAVLITSSNGVRAFAAGFDWRDRPAFTVGTGSAASARDAGFERVESADGTVEDLAALVARRCDPGAGTLLHVAGSVVAGDLSGRLATTGFHVKRLVLYDARLATALSVGVREALVGGRVAAVLFFSPRTARTFVRLATAAAVAPACCAVSALCLSPAVAEVLGAIPWRDVRVAARPNRAALLALLGIPAEALSADQNP
ncbi:MAG: uroporphyrinogen-III synthase [Azospirillaceae bacterium]|nr:uroporphyrinogen-III synthase [Azospirillaceae bacterium]